MNTSLKKQRGMTMTGIMLLVIAICSAVVLVLKISPVYMNHGKIKSSIEAIKTLPGVEDKNKGEIAKALYDRFDINQVNREGMDANSIMITKRANYLKIQIKYQVEVPIIANMYALMKFDDSIETGKE